MTSIAENLAENCGQRLIDGVLKEAGYLCCFNTYATKFEDAKRQLKAKRDEVQKDIEDASKKDETRVEDGVELWIKDVDVVINEDIKTRQKCFYGLCCNCIWQYRQAKELEQKTLDITGFFERRREFTRVARPSKNPGIKFYAPPMFIDFKSRKLKFDQLVEALEKGNHNMIGLQGLGGMGKTTLAQQVGVHVEESNSFQEVIFTTVSNPLDINKIRHNIAGQLNFQLEGEEEEQHSKALWSRIANSKPKVLIILDDIWGKLELRDIGIPNNHKNCCVLITTRDSKVCEAMGCQPTVSLNTLEGRDGLDIFIKQVGTRSEDSTSEFMDLAQEIVNACGGLPLAIVAIATMLKGLQVREWKNVLKPLLNSEPLHNDDYKDWIKVRSSLKLSYDRLENKAKGLLLLCSLFPKDYEIPMELLNKLGIGLGLFGEAKNYSKLREKLILAKNDLIKSFLLLETKEACVKMHDLVREVALWIEDKDVQVIMNSSGELKSNLKFLSWSNNGFPNHLGGTKLTVLLLWIKGEVKVEDSHAMIKDMINLRVLFLCYDKDVVYPTLSLQSFLSLKNMQTLILNGWKLGDISILVHLNNLVTLEFENCLIMDLPKEIVQLENLRLLGIRRCKIERKNPFEVVGSCSRLEELYFVKNVHAIDSEPEDKDEVAHGKSHPALQMYSIACSGLQYFVDEDNGLYKCFNTKHVKNLMPEEMFKYLVERAEILELWEMREARWRSFVPGLIPMKDGVMKGLIKLCLYDCVDIECLLDIIEPLGDASVFSNLVELHLVGVDVKDLYRGRMPSGFLSELKTFKLLHCKNLCNKFFYGNLKLPHLKVLQMDDCPMFKASIFRPSVARSLVLLEELSIKDCELVETLIEYQSPREEVVVDADHQNSDGFLFPKLKSLKIQGCGKLELLLSFLLAGDLCLLEDLSIRSCEKLEYLFGEYRHEGQALYKNSMLPSLTTMELEDVSSLINICKVCNKCMQRASPMLKNDLNSKTLASTWARGCCCLPTISSEFGASMKRNETSHPADQRPLRQSSSLRNIREMKLMGCSKSKSLFCVPIATIVMLEKLKIQGCHKLKHVISNEREERDDMNSSSIFPELKMLEIKDCNELESLFPSTFSRSLQRLRSIGIDGTPKLKYIFGGYQYKESFSDKNEKNEVPIRLLALESLSLINVPQIISICAKSYYLQRPSLKHINLGQCGELVKRPFPHSMVCLQERQAKLEIGDQEPIRRPCPDFMDCLRGRQPNLETGVDCMKLLMDMQNLTSLGIRHSEIEEIFNLEGIEREVEVELKLQVLEIEGLHKLRCIYKDPRKILNFCNLEALVFSQCDQLTAIFSTSTMKRLPRLSHLEVTQCRELVYIIEDDDDGSRQLRCPKLQKIHISHCDKLKSLFLITTFGTLQELDSMEIEAAFNLEEVFGCRQDDTQERGLEDVVPKLSHLKLKNLPNLGSFCRGIDVQSVEKFVLNFEVVDCAIWEKPKGPERHQEIGELRSTYSNTGQAMTRISDRELPTSSQVHSHLDIPNHVGGKPERKEEIETQGLTSALSNLAEDIDDVTRKTGVEVPLSRTSTMAPSSSDSALTRGLSTEETMKTQANGPTPALEKKASETSPAQSEMTRTSPRSNDTIRNDRVQEGHTSKDDVAATRNSLATLVNARQTAIDRIPEDTAITKRKVDPYSIDSQVGGSKASQATLTTKKTRYASVQEGPKLEKATKANLPHAIPSCYQGVAGPSQILGIGEILEVMELKEGEPALLAKALELYPQLRLSREQRTRPIIAFSYRVLIDILLMLATKTPSTINASDKLTLREKLDAATYFGFDKDWIQSVRTKVFSNDMFGALATEEEIPVKKAKLETYSTTLEQVQNQRIEAIERLAGARRRLDLVQSELEAIDSQLFGQLEERKKLIIGMMHFRETIRAKYGPFGI